MGHDPDLFIEFPPALMCGICQAPAEDPKQCAQGHLFCADCIKQWLDKSKTCPMDRAKVESVVDCLVAKQMVAELPVRCIHASNERPRDCGWTGKFSALETHLKDCEVENTACELCNTKMAHQEFAKHRKKCPKRSVVCENGKCDWAGLAQDLDEHSNVCPESKVSCDLCCVYMSRKNFARHNKKYAEKHVNILKVKVPRIDVTGQVESHERVWDHACTVYAPNSGGVVSPFQWLVFNGNVYPIMFVLAAENSVSSPKRWCGLILDQYYTYPRGNFQIGIQFYKEADPQNEFCTELFMVGDNGSNIGKLVETKMLRKAHASDAKGRLCARILVRFEPE